MGSVADHLIIQSAQKEHLPSVERIAQAAYEKYVDRIGKAPAPMVADFARHLSKQELFVGVMSENCVGFCVCYPSQAYFHISNVAVLPELQGKGYGKRLIAWAEARAWQTGWTEVQLYTNEKMTENLSFYRQIGYREYDRQRQDGFNRVLMRKILKPQIEDF